MDLLLFLTMGEGIDVMDESDVDALQSEALQAVFEGAHHAVIAVVERACEWGGVDPGREIDLLSGRWF